MNIAQSVDRLMSSKDAAVEVFYDKLFQQHPEVKTHFHGVDLKRQAKLLTMALVMVEGHYSHSYPIVEHYLHVLGDRHKDRGIPPEMFPMFGDCLLETLLEIHREEWDKNLADQWQQAIDKTITTMLQGYDRSYIY